MSSTITPLSQLPLSDDFMFGEVMRQPDVCRLFLECLLEKDIAHIEYISKQEDMTDDVSGHGIRLDVYLNDAAGTHYDIEMQKTSSNGLERRIRYYQSGIDRRCLGKGLDYTELPESFVIFICDFDYYHAGLARYERISRINGRGDIVYDDGSHAIILNSHYEEGNAPAPILEFLDYVRTNNDQLHPSSELVQRAKQAVHTVRNDRTKEVPYMTWAMKTRDLLRQGREEGRAEGLEEGRAEGRAEGREEGRAEGLEEGRAEGLEEGRAEMREEGIKALVVTLKGLSQTPSLAIQKVVEQFGLSAMEAEEKTKLYWEQ